MDASVGGETGLVDGFHAASHLRVQYPEAFETLTCTCTQFAFSDSTTELSTLKPLIGVNPQARIREVRFSNRHMQPLRASPAKVVAFFTSYRRFAELIYDPAAQVTFKLRPGDAIVFDNTRILHARTAFDSAGERYLQGCYADLDSLASSLNVLLRDRGSASKIYEYCPVAADWVPRVGPAA